MLFSYLSYLLTAQDEHAIHSPFVFELYTEVIRTDDVFYAFEEIEALRDRLLANNQTITITDLGAGSRINYSNERKISEIAQYSLKNPKCGELLFKLVNFLKPKVVLDLGTSLGITTLYQAKACLEAKFLTFEGCPAIAQLAQTHFDEFNCNNIEIIVGNLDKTLPETIQNLSQIDYAFFDANHRYEPTIRYFETCLEKAHEDSLFIFDDIHWSAEMQQAWRQIKNHPKVMLTIDLFEVGLVFFRSKQVKQHFVLKF